MKKKPAQTLREKINEIPKAERIESVGRIFVRHLSESEKDSLKEQLVNAMILELKAKDEAYKQLYDSHIKLMNGHDVLMKKFLKLKKSKSKISNRK